MFNLMKYEFKKVAFSKLVLVVLTAVLEIYFIFSILNKDLENIAMSSVLLMTLVYITLVYLAIEVVTRYSKDLKEKCSYMLFLTPHSSYTILGAKVIYAGLQIIIALVIFLVIFIINTKLAIDVYDVNMFFEEFMYLLSDSNVIEQIDFYLLGSIVLNTIVSWLLFILSAMSAITLSSTIFSNKKFKGLVSFIIYLVIYIAFLYLLDAITGAFYFSSQSAEFMVRSIITFSFTGFMYIFTGWLLENKVSV